MMAAATTGPCTKSETSFAELPPEMSLQIFKHCDADSRVTDSRVSRAQVRSINMEQARDAVLAVPLFHEPKWYQSRRISKQSRNFVINRHVADFDSTLAEDLNTFAIVNPANRETILKRYAENNDFEALLIFEKTCRAFDLFIYESKGVYGSLPIWITTMLTASFQSEKGCQFSGYLYKKYSLYSDSFRQTAPVIGTGELKNLVRYGDLTIRDLANLDRSDSALVDKTAKAVMNNLMGTAIGFKVVALIVLILAVVLAVSTVHPGVVLLFSGTIMTLWVIVTGSMSGAAVLVAAGCSAAAGLCYLLAWHVGSKRPDMPLDLPADDASDAVDA